MKYQRDLRKFLNTILFNQKQQKDKLLVHHGFMSKQIPKTLLTSELEKSGKVVLTLIGEEFQKFKLIYQELRKDIFTEYLKDRELEDLQVKK